MLVLTLNPEGKLEKHEVLKVLPKGHSIVGLSFRKYYTIANQELAADYFGKHGSVFVAWSVGPAQYVMENAETGALRLTSKGDYIILDNEYPVAAIFGIDFFGRSLQATFIEGKHNSLHPVSDFIVENFPQMEWQVERYIKEG